MIANEAEMVDLQVKKIRYISQSTKSCKSASANKKVSKSMSYNELKNLPNHEEVIYEESDSSMEEQMNA